MELEEKRNCEKLFDKTLQGSLDIRSGILTETGDTFALGWRTTSRVSKQQVLLRCPYQPESQSSVIPLDNSSKCQLICFPIQIDLNDKRNVVTRKPISALMTFKKQEVSTKKTVTLIEIWDLGIDILCSIPEGNLAVSADESTHGSVHKHSSADAIYLLHPAEDKIDRFTVGLYIAEAPQAKEGNVDFHSQHEYDYKEDWGEQRTGESVGKVYMCDFSSSTIVALDLCEDFSYSDPQYLMRGLDFVVVGQSIQPFRLGTLYCNNRQQTLFLVEVCLSDTNHRQFAPKVKKIVQLSPSSQFSNWGAMVTTLKPPFDERLILYSSIAHDVPESKTHWGCSTLRALTLSLENTVDEKLPWKIKSDIELVPRISLPLGNGTFAGLYGSNGFFTYMHEGHIKTVTSTNVGPYIRAVMIDSETKKTTVLKLMLNWSLNHSISDKDFIMELEGCCCVLNTSHYLTSAEKNRKPLILLAYSSPNCPVVLMVGHIEKSLEHGWVIGAVPVYCQNTYRLMNDLLDFLLKTYPLDERSSSRTYVALDELLYTIKWTIYEDRHICLWSNKKWVAGSPIVVQGQRALLVVLHGGPHSISTAAYVHSRALFVALGFVVLCINYKGSIGFGADDLLSLPGNIGVQDVDECAAITQQFIENWNVRIDYSSKIDASRVFCVGGSHGGFLTLHLIGKYPYLFQAASCRNPVANLSTMMGTTDIPDWAYHESQGVDESQMKFQDIIASRGCRDQILSKQSYKTLIECSPIILVENVRTPILMALGENDRRVPHSQGLEYCRYLKAVTKGTDKSSMVRVLLYPGDGHSLDKPQHDSDYWLNVVSWFKENGGEC